MEVFLYEHNEGQVRHLVRVIVWRFFNDEIRINFHWTGSHWERMRDVPLKNVTTGELESKQSMLLGVETGFSVPKALLTNEISIDSLPAFSPGLIVPFVSGDVETEILKKKSDHGKSKTLHEHALSVIHDGMSFEEIAIHRRELKSRLTDFEKISSGAIDDFTRKSMIALILLVDVSSHLNRTFSEVELDLMDFSLEVRDAYIAQSRFHKNSGVVSDFDGRAFWSYVIVNRVDFESQFSSENIRHQAKNHLLMAYNSNLPNTIKKLLLDLDKM